MLFLDACRSRNASRPPLWIMRQAGRYLPEYRQMREKHSFVEMCTTPDLAVEVSLQPFRRFRFDAVIVFYDILFLPEAMGAPLAFTDDGPVFERPIRVQADVGALHLPDLHAADARRGTGAVLSALRTLRREVPADTAVLGFAGAPFTVAAYLIEGKFGKDGGRIKRALNEEPRLVHSLMARLAASTGEYLAAQIEAGATAVQLFDSWAGLLGADDYREHVLPYTRIVLDRVAAAGAPAIHYANGGSHLLDEFAHLGAAVLSVDWREPLAAVRRRVGPQLALQGNLDPAALFGPPESVRARTRAILQSMHGDGGHVFNLGHGILPETPLEAVEALADEVRSFAPA